MATRNMTPVVHTQADKRAYLEGSLLPRFAGMRAELNALMIEREALIDQLMTCLVAGESIVIFGAPGTGKTYAAELMAQFISVADSDVFYMLVRRTSHESEAFGPRSVKAMENDEIRFITDGMLPRAKVVILDEVFKGGSYLLNGWLRIMNEKKFKVGKYEEHTPWLLMVGASNELPQESDLAAFFDRFRFRTFVMPLTERGRHDLLRLTRKQHTPRSTFSEDDIRLMQEFLPSVTVPESVYDSIEKLTTELLGQGITVSDRRFASSVKVLQAYAMSQGRMGVDEDDMAILVDMFWNTTDWAAAQRQRETVNKAVGQLGSPIKARANAVRDQALSVRKQAVLDYNEAVKNKADAAGKLVVVSQGLSKMNALGEQLNKIVSEAREANAAALPHILKAQAEVESWRKAFLQAAMGKPLQVED